MPSKLPEVGTTIFTIMSRRARELNALNLGQGFPDYDIDPRLTEFVAAAMRSGHNQYAPMEGLAVLRERIAAKLESYYAVKRDPEKLAQLMRDRERLTEMTRDAERMAAVIPDVTETP